MSVKLKKVGPQGYVFYYDPDSLSIGDFTSGVHDHEDNPGGGTLDHGDALTGLSDDDHTQYHTNARGDARYYTETELDAGQLNTIYYTETELNAGQLDTRYYTETEIDSTLAVVDQELLLHNLTGFEDDSLVALSSDSGTPPTLTLTFTGTVAWWSDGVRYTDSGTDNIQISDVSGTHVIYYNGATLSEVVNPTHDQLDAVIINKAVAMIVYWNTNTNTTPILARETHGVQMSGRTHEWLHDNIGAKYREGGTLSGYTLNTASDAAISFDLTDIVFYDEDLKIDVEDGAAANQYEQVLTGDAELPVLYKDDVDGSWAEQAASTLPYIVGGTPRLAYNDNDGDGTWSQVEIGTAKFMLMWMVTTNDWQYPVKMVQGTEEYSTAAAALQGSATEIINWGTMPAAEFVIMYQLIMQASSGGTKNAKIVSIIDYRTSNLTGASYTPTDHGTLTGLGDDDHAQYSLVSQPYFMGIFA